MGRFIIFGITLLSLAGSFSNVFGGFWGVSDNDSEADATVPPPAPVATVRIKPGAMAHKVVLGIANMNTEIVSGNNGVFGYTFSYGITQKTGVSAGIGIFQGNFKENTATTIYETKGLFVPLQLNLQYALLTAEETNVNVFGGGSYVYGRSNDKIMLKSDNSVVFDETATANVYGAQIGLVTEKTFGNFGFSGFIMLQSIRGYISYPNQSFDIENTYLFHGSVEFIYLPFKLGIYLYHQRDFNSKGNVTSVGATYKF